MENIHHLVSTVQADRSAFHNRAPAPSHPPLVNHHASARTPSAPSHARATRPPPRTHTRAAHETTLFSRRFRASTRSRSSRVQLRASRSLHLQHSPSTSLPITFHARANPSACRKVIHEDDQNFFSRPIAITNRDPQRPPTRAPSHASPNAPQRSRTQHSSRCQHASPTAHTRPSSAQRSIPSIYDSLHRHAPAAPHHSPARPHHPITIAMRSPHDRRRSPQTRGAFAHIPPPPTHPALDALAPDSADGPSVTIVRGTLTRRDR